MKLIGISSSTTENRTFVNSAYHNAFIRPNVASVALPQISIPSREVITIDEYCAEHKERFEGYAERLDALCVSGGIDINPVVFDESNWGAASCDSERDFMEIGLIRAFHEADKPILGICRGHQTIGHYLGLSNFAQDLGKIDELHNTSDREMKDRQEPAHKVAVFGAFRDYMRRKTGRPELTHLTTNSFHHQAYLLNPSGHLPKHVKTTAQVTQWYTDALNQYQADNDINVLAATLMVVEAYEKEEMKTVCFQNHVEEYTNSLSIGYWLDRYVLV